ncbi:Ras GTPase-activating-like protein iqgap1 [Ameca splendens]|uniref:Ras GTPase-activating-like protein iqgap1 n=1 Tax=Ameca splendens TaxID=208324 RepID=A0ABV0YNH7_9TELE
MSTSDDTDGPRPRYGSVLDCMERLTAEEMDERRQQNMAYEYLCHLEEAKRSWSILLSPAGGTCFFPSTLNLDPDICRQQGLFLLAEHN